MTVDPWAIAARTHLDQYATEPAPKPRLHRWRGGFCPDHGCYVREGCTSCPPSGRVQERKVAA